MHRTITAIAGLLFVAGCSESPIEPSALRIATQVVIVQGDSQIAQVHGPLAAPVAVRVLDDRNEPVAGQLVSWVVVKGGGSVFTPAGLTDANGRSQQIWTLGDTAGVQQLEARAIDSTGAPITFARVTATGTPGPLAYQGVTGRRTFVFLDSLMPLPIVARDAWGNAVPPAAVVAIGDTMRMGGVRNGGSWQPRDVGIQRFVFGNDTIFAFAIRRPFQWSRTSGSSGTAAFLGVDSSQASACTSWCAAINYSGGYWFWMNLNEPTGEQQSIGIGAAGYNRVSVDSIGWHYYLGNFDTLTVRR